MIQISAIAHLVASVLLLLQTLLAAMGAAHVFVFSLKQTNNG